MSADKGIRSGTACKPRIAAISEPLRKVLVLFGVVLPLLSARGQPTFIQQPVSTSGAVGTTVQFIVSASGAGTLSYQWQKVGTNLANGVFPGRATVSGATTATLQLTNITTNDQSTYACLVTNLSGSSLSSNANLLVIVAPTITTQPASYNTNVGASVMFSVLAAGTGPLSYQWQKNASPLAGANGNAYSIGGLTTNDSANYSVVVSNSVGKVTSTNGVLNVGIAPALTLQPASLTVTQGQSATFNVAASGIPLNYFWRKNGVFIPGATNTSLTFTNVVPTNAAAYSCQVSNFLNSSVLTTNAVLTVLYPPTISLQPSNQTIGVGSNFTVSVTASGNPAIGYQWRTNGTAIPGATTSGYTVSGAQTNNSADYTVVLTNSQGSVTSAVATITVLYYSPTMGLQPVGGNVPVGSNFTLSASAFGTAPLTWQWRDNSNSIPGANTNTHTIASAQLSDIGFYDVIVSNISGSVTSSVAFVNVGYAPAVTQQPVPVTNLAGGNANFSCVVTGSPPIMLQWTLNGYPISAATNSGLSLTNIQSGNIGFYALTATNIFGAAVSSNAALSLNGYNFSQWAGLEAYYPLNGDATDASGNGNTGTNFGTAAITDRFGNTNGAMLFNGVNNYIRCKSGAYFGSNYTVSAWVYETAYNNWSRILDFGNGAPANNTLLALTAGTSGQPDWEAYIGGTSTGACAPASAVPLNSWVQVVGTCDGTQSCVYYNGVRKAVLAIQMSRQPVTTALNYLGRSNWAPDSYLAGRLDDIRIFNRTLSSNEVAQLYAVELQSTLLPLQSLSGRVALGSGLNLRFAAQPFSNYVLLTATNLAAPNPWQPLVTNPADINGMWQFTDTNVNSAQKFYRVAAP